MPQHRRTKIIMKRTSICIFLMLTLTTFMWYAPNAKSQGSISNPLGRVLFSLNLAYEIDAAGVTIPPGEYVVRDMGLGSQNLLSISCPYEFESVALLHTTRRQLVYGREDVLCPRLVFE